MRSALPFDTHAFVKRLVATGVPEAQAEVHADVLADMLVDQLATKRDLMDLEGRLEARIDRFEAEIDGRFQQVDSRFQRVDARLQELELRLTVRLGMMLAAAIAVMAALVKLL